MLNENKKTTRVKGPTHVMVALPLSNHFAKCLNKLTPEERTAVLLELAEGYERNYGFMFNAIDMRRVMNQIMEDCITHGKHIGKFHNSLMTLQEFAGRFEAVSKLMNEGGDYWLLR